MRNLNFIIITCIALLFSCIKQDEVDIDGEITITPLNNALIIGNKFQYEATYFEGDKRADGVSFNWESSDPSIATVDANGVVTAIDSGVVMISASTFNKKSEGSLLNIVTSNSAPAKIEISPKTTYYTTVEKNIELSTQVFDVSGNKVNNFPISWSSSDESIATVNENGIVTPVKTGNVTITARTAGIESPQFNVAVLKSLERSISFYTIDYKTEGTGSLVLSGNNELIIEFNEDFEAENATSLPGIVVYLSGNDGNDPEDANQTLNSGLDFGDIPQNKGPFSMKVTVDDPVEEMLNHSHVLLICKPFRISFGAGTLSN